VTGWIYYALNDSSRIPAEKRMDYPRMESALKEAKRLNPQSAYVVADYGCFLVFNKGDPIQAKKLLLSSENQSKLTGKASYCLAFGEYLNWAQGVLKGKVTDLHSGGGGRGNQGFVGQRLSNREPLPQSASSIRTG
jgi:hypothetical protein